MTGPVLVQYALDEVWAQWVRLADGLQIQRVYAHLAEVRDVLAGDGPLPDVDGVRGHQLVALPATFGALAVAARPYIIRPELAHWLEVPLRLGEVSEEPAPLHAAARDVAAEMRSRRPCDLADAVEAVCLAASWWVGFFSVIRHTGVQHRTYEQCRSSVDLATLQDAVRATAAGTTVRLLAGNLETTSSAEVVDAYCVSLSAAICDELAVPELLERLDELRLVDLVSAYAVWRGQFMKYEGGTGPGQVE